VSTESKARILLVEDEIITAAALEKSLRNLGYDVVGIVSSGEAAIRQAAEKAPDLILMDVRLQGAMDGIAAAQEIQSNFEIPVVYLTAHSDEETVERIMQSHPYGCLFKPYDKEDLHNAIEAALAWRQHRAR
jgi:DNA-binding NarL/FixJ family response regulator